MNGPSLRTEPLTFEPYIYDCGEEIRLPKVEIKARETSFVDVFSERRSVKNLGICPLEMLSQILYLAVKPYTIGQDDYGVTVFRSAAPSAGGRHPIDVLVGQKEEGERRLYLYKPLKHSLRRLMVAAELQRAFFESVEETLPLGESVMLWFSMQYMRTASKYTGYESLVWRDAGAQLCCLQQAAKYVDIDSCPIGYLAEETFGAMFKTDKLMSGGGLIIGKRN